MLELRDALHSYTVNNSEITVRRSLQTLHRLQKWTKVNKSEHSGRLKKVEIFNSILGIFTLFLFLVHHSSLETNNRGAVTLKGA